MRYTASETSVKISAAGLKHLSRNQQLYYSSAEISKEIWIEAVTQQIRRKEGSANSFAQTAQTSCLAVPCSQLVLAAMRPPAAAAFVVVNVLQLLATLVVNVLLCAAVYKFRSLRTLANSFLVSLAVVDLLFVVIFASNIAQHTTHGADPTLCFISAEVSHTVTCLVVFHLMAIAIDRLLAITLHLRYREVVTSRRVGLAIAFLWVFGVFVAFAPALVLRTLSEETRNARQLQHGCLPGGPPSDGWTEDLKKYIVIEKVVVIAIPYMVILLCYAWIFKISWWHHKRIKVEESRNISEQDHVRKVEMKAAKTTAIIIGSFTLMFSPLLAVSVRAVLMGPKKGKPGDTEKFMHLVIPSLKALAATSAFVNPPVYAYRSTPFREAFNEILQPIRSFLPSCANADDQTRSGENETNDA